MQGKLGVAGWFGGHDWGGGRVHRHSLEGRRDEAEGLKALGDLWQSARKGWDGRGRAGGGGVDVTDREGTLTRGAEDIH